MFHIDPGVEFVSSNSLLYVFVLLTWR